MEKKMYKWDQLNLSGSSTPPTELLYVYAQNDLIPSDLTVELCMTYMQFPTTLAALMGAITLQLPKIAWTMDGITSTIVQCRVQAAPK